MCISVFDGARINFRELRLSNLVVLDNFCIVGYGFCIDNFSYSIQCIFLIPCRRIVDIMEMYMWIFYGPRFHFDGITAFKT